MKGELVIELRDHRTAFGLSFDNGLSGNDRRRYYEEIERRVAAADLVKQLRNLASAIECGEETDQKTDQLEGNAGERRGEG